jgi:hypothetical protein
MEFLNFTSVPLDATFVTPRKRRQAKGQIERKSILSWMEDPEKHMKSFFQAVWISLTRTQCEALGASGKHQGRSRRIIG